MESAYKELKIPVKYFNYSEGVDTMAFCTETIKLGDTRLANKYCPELYYDIVNKKQIPPVCEIHSDKTIIINENRKGETGW
jgi:hypothetical protein